MAKCYWCHKDKKLYAFNLCVSCYRWFHRRKTNPIKNCEVCGKVIMKTQKDICKPCKTVLEKTTKIPKRIEVLEAKYQAIAPMLDKFESDSQAFTYLEHFFKPKQKKLLEILIDRYYHRENRLEDIGKLEEVLAINQACGKLKGVKPERVTEVKELITTRAIFELSYKDTGVLLGWPKKKVDRVRKFYNRHKEIFKKM